MKWRRLGTGFGINSTTKLKVGPAGAKRARDLRSCRVVSLSRVTGFQTPRSEHFLALAAVLVLTSAGLEFVVLPVVGITGLDPFSLSAYGPRACWPTLRSEHYCSPPKVLLLGGWLGLPRSASHPLDYMVLPGRFQA
jgi:hypothetical protein